MRFLQTLSPKNSTLKMALEPFQRAIKLGQHGATKSEQKPRLHLDDDSSFIQKI